MIKKPVYLLSGGIGSGKASMNAVLNEIYAHTGKEKPRVAYIGAANGDSKFFYNMMKGFLRSDHPVQMDRVVLVGKKGDREAATAMLRTADAIHMAGGDVEEGMKWIQKHELAPLLQELYGKGTVFFGASAGSIMLGSSWVRWRDPDDDSTAELFNCLGIVPLLCDTHAEKEGWEELKVAVTLLADGKKGYGIPTGCTLRIAPDGAITALGKPAVSITHANGKPGDLDNIEVEG